jgi:hypothetical protein
MAYSATIFVQSLSLLLPYGGKSQSPSETEYSELYLLPRYRYRAKKMSGDYIPNSVPLRFIKMERL